MIEYKEIPESNIIEFSIDGKIDAEDYHKLAENFLKFLDQHGTVRVLKEIKSYEGFDLEILREKLLGELLKHQKDISHAAVVTDEDWVHQISKFFAPAFHCKTRFYKLNEKEKALDWLRSAKTDSIEVTSDSKDNLMVFKVSDKLTHEDYQRTLIPTLESVIKECGRARLLIDFGKEFHGIEPAAMWDDTKFGIKHRTDFEKIAIVGGPSWSTWAARLGEAMMPCEVISFSSEEYEKALDWINQPVGSAV